MEPIHTLFLEALEAALKNETVDWQAPLPEEDWIALFQMAEQQRVLPMILEAVLRSEAGAQMPRAVLMPVKQGVIRSVTMQALRTDAFFSLYDELRAAQLTPVVVKGVVCRELYPNPDHRMSGDEDILLPRGQLRACHQALLAAGLTTEASEDETATEYETLFFSRDHLQHIEVHSSLFPPESDALGDLAALFDGTLDRAGDRPVAGHTLRTLSHTDHMLFLICHALKHFLHSGFGLRQVCDIALYANVHGGAIDWETVLRGCRAVRAEKFAAALFAIAAQYLTLDVKRAQLPEVWAAPDVNPAPMLADLLGSGIYGSASMSRRHSSRITLSAVSASKRGATERAGVLKAAFPSAQALEGRYPYLKTKKWLLPVAWAQRIAQYRRETAHARNNSAADAVRIGMERTALLKEYDIIRSDN